MMIPLIHYKKPLRTNIFQISVTGHNGVYALDPKVE